MATLFLIDNTQLTQIYKQEHGVIKFGIDIQKKRKIQYNQSKSKLNQIP